MSVVIHAPNSLPLTDSTYPEGNLEYSTASSYAYWIAAGGPGNNPPDPSWTCAEANLPGTVESRTDDSHVLNELLYTAVGGEMSVSLTLTAPVCPSSLYLSTEPVLTVGDSSNYTFAFENGGQVLPQLNNWGVSSGILTATLNSGGTRFAIGRQYTIGAVTGSAPRTYGNYVVQCTNDGGGHTGSTVTFSFVGPAPADFAPVTSGSVYLTPNSDSQGIQGSQAPMASTTGSINYLTGAITLNFSAALTAGTKIYATYGVRDSNLGSFVTPWANLSALQGGSGPATCTLPVMSYDAIYGSSFFGHSELLVCRNFGFAIPNGATIQRVVFCWEGTSEGTNAQEVYSHNPATLVGNVIQRAPFTQCAGDLGNQYYSDPNGVQRSDSKYGTSTDYWPDSSGPWPGSTANNGTSEFAGSETWNQDFLDEGNGGVGYSTKGSPVASLISADINDSGFGFAISAFNQDLSSGNPASISVKSVRMLVYYTGGSGGVDPNISTVVASPVSVLSNGATQATITVTLLTTSGTPVSGKTVGLSGTGQSTITPSSGVSDSNGRVTFTSTSTVVNKCVYSAVDDTDSIFLTQTATVQFTGVQSFGTLFSQFGPVLAGYQVFIVSPLGIQPVVGDNASESNTWDLVALYADETPNAPISQPLTTGGGSPGYQFFCSAAQEYSIVVCEPEFGNVVAVYPNCEAGISSEQFPLRQYWIKSPLGLALTNAQVFVCSQPCTTPATLKDSNGNYTPPSPLLNVFSGPNGGLPEDALSQPLLSDTYGRLGIYAAAGQLATVLVYSGGRLALVLNDQSFQANAAMPRYDYWQKDSLGRSVAGASVYVTQDGNPVQLYADSAGQTPLQQPLSTDGNGFAFFYVPSAGTYDLSVYSGSSLITSLTDLYIL